MVLTSYQINLYIIFFLIISIISLFYVYSNFKNIESVDNTRTPYNTYSITTNKFNLGNKIEHFIPDISTNIVVDDRIVQNIITNNITTMSPILDKYRNLDVPIIINNNKICDPWGNYNNGKYSKGNYKTDNNQCLIVDGQHERTCLTGSDTVSCSNYYDDGYINNLNVIDINNILNTIKQRILIDYDNLKANSLEKDKKIYNILNDLIAKRNLENQQLSFIEYNKTNINDKQQLVNKLKKDFEKSENEININQIEFAHFLEDNRNIDSQVNIYYKIIIGIIFFIIIMGILNILFRNTL